MPSSTNIVRDPLRRLTRINHFGLSLSDYTYTPASQLLTRSISNTAFVWDDDVEVDLDYAVNHLNQYTSAGATSFTYDHNGNLTDDGTRTYLYDLENRMRRAIGANGGHRMRYDGRGRLLRRWGAGHTRGESLYDGDSLIAEYNDVTGVMQRRFIHGPGVDDPIVWYEGAGTAAADRRFLHADERGSITAITDNGGAVIHINSYDDWGIPANDTSGVTNIGRFQYTGQQYLPETGLYHYRARMYSPILGRFMQTDPIGYDDGMNMYAYVGNDPMNMVDPSGLSTENREGPDRGCGSGTPSESAACRNGTADTAVAHGTEEAVGTASGSTQNVNNQILTNIRHCESAVTCDIARDERAVLSGEMSEEEFRERSAARAGGAVAGVAGLAIIRSGGQATMTAGGALAQRMVLSDRTGVFSRRYGNRFFRSLFSRSRRGTLNQGAVRLGWSYNARSGILTFQPRVGPWHVPSPIRIRVPDIYR